MSRGSRRGISLADDVSDKVHFGTFYNEEEETSKVRRSTVQSQMGNSRMSLNLFIFTTSLGFFTTFYSLIIFLLHDEDSFH